MESALYGTYALVVFVSENSCVNTVQSTFHEVIYISIKQLDYQLEISI